MMKHSLSLNQCIHCRGKFGLIRYPSPLFRGAFCSKACHDGFILKRQQEIERYKRWMGYT